jgi:exocyst complex component 2
MANLERNVLEFYKLSTLYPSEWPAEKNEEEEASDEEDESFKRKAGRRKSRYQALERAVSNRASIVPGSENSGKGVGNLVQRDEQDPLGTTDSVVRTLDRMGVPVQDDTRLRKSLTYLEERRMWLGLTMILYR